MPADTLPLRLVQMRHELGLSQRDAAARCGITFGEWQSMEAGRSARSLDIKVAKISAALGYDRDWLMWGAETGNPTPPANGTAVTKRDRAGKLPRLDSNQQPAGMPRSKQGYLARVLRKVA